METILISETKTEKDETNNPLDLTTLSSLKLTKDDILDICNSIAKLHTLYPIEFWKNKSSPWHNNNNNNNNNSEYNHLNKLHFLALRLASTINEEQLFFNKFQNIKDEISKEIASNSEKIKQQRRLKEEQEEHEYKEEKRKREEKEFLDHQSRIAKANKAQQDKLERVTLALELLKSAERKPNVKRLLKKTVKQIHESNKKIRSNYVQGI